MNRYLIEVEYKNGIKQQYIYEGRELRDVLDKFYYEWYDNKELPHPANKNIYDLTKEQSMKIHVGCIVDWMEI